MTSEEAPRWRLPDDWQPAAPDPEPNLPPPEEEEDRSIVGWVRAIGLGIRDTWQDMVDEGRKGAREAYDEGWRNFETKTKHRRRSKTEDTP